MIITFKKLFNDYFHTDSSCLKPDIHKCRIIGLYLKRCFSTFVSLIMVNKLYGQAL